MFDCLNVRYFDDCFYKLNVEATAVVKLNVEVMVVVKLNIEVMMVVKLILLMLRCFVEVFC